MQMKYKIVYIFTYLFVSSLMSQNTSLTANEINHLKEKVDEVSKATKSFKTDFVQFKHMDFLDDDIVTKGELTYKTPNLIRWEYNDPFNYIVVFKSDKLFIDDNGKKNNINIGSNKLFGKLNQLITGSAQGVSMFNEDDFNIKYYKSNDGYLVSFFPKEEQILRFLKQIDFTFNKDTYRVAVIKMMEPSGDYSRIEFDNMQVNKPVSDAVFSID